MINFKLIIIILCLLISGCSGQNIFPSETPKSYLTKSEDYHNFIVGELSFKNEDLTRSYQHYQSFVAKASEDNVTPVVRLIEIALTKPEEDEAIFLFRQKINTAPEIIDYILLSHLYQVRADWKNAMQIISDGLVIFPQAQDLLITKFFGEARQVKDSDGVIALFNQIQDSKVKNFILPIIAEAYFQNNDLINADLTFKECQIHSNECILLDNEYLEFLIRTKNLPSLKNYLQNTKNLNRSHKFVTQQLAENPSVGEMPGQLESILEESYINISDVIRDYNFKFLSSFISQQDVHYTVLSLQIFSLLYPDFVPVRFYLASFYNNLKKPDLAVQEFMSIPSDNPQFLKARLGAVSILQQTKRYSEASEVVDDLIEKSEEGNKLNLWLIQIKLLHEQSKFQTLQSKLPKLIEEFPGNEALMFEYAVVLQELNRDFECLEVLAAILERNANHKDALNFVAYTYAESDRELDLAHQYVDQALSFDPQNPYYIDTKAWIYFKQKRYPEALEKIRYALKFLPDDPILLEHLGDILMAMGEDKQAQEAYQKSFLLAQEGVDYSEIRDLKKRLKLKVRK